MSVSTLPRRPIAEPPPAAEPSTARPRPWRRLVADWGIVGAGEIVCQVLGALTSIALRMALDPARMGVWQMLKLLLTNSNYASLGASKGAAREIAIAGGRGDHAGLLRTVRLGFTVNTLSSVLYAAALIVAGGWFFARGHGDWGLGLAATGVLVVLQRHVTFQVTVLRARQQFAATSQLSLIEAALTLVVVCGATWSFGLAGLYVGTAMVMLAAAGFLRRRSIPLGLAWDRAEVRRLIAIGGPVMLAGLASTLFRSLDKLLILGFSPHGEFELGCYSIALLASAQLYGLGNMLAIVIAPRLAEGLGRSGSAGDVARLAALAGELQALALALPAGLAVVVGPPVFDWLLPKYAPGLGAMVALVPGTVALAMTLIPTHFLVTVDRQRWNLATVLLATPVGAAAVCAALFAGGGITAVAVATSGGYAFYLLLVVWPLWTALPRSGVVRWLLMHAVALAPTAAAAAACLALRPPLALGVAVVAAAWSFSVVAAWRLGGWRERLRST